MTDIVLGPVLSLYSVAFYRRLAQQRLGRGLAYLVYLSSLYAAAIAIALLAFWLPAADRFVDWLAPNLPEVKLTDHGAVTDTPQPFVLTHPTLGTLLAIDTRVETPSADDLRGAPVFFVSRTHVVVSEGREGQQRVYDLVPQTPLTPVPPSAAPAVPALAVPAPAVPGAAVPGAPVVNPTPPAPAPTAANPPNASFLGASAVSLARLRLNETLGSMNNYDVEIHKKFALAVACVVFVLLGAPIALRFPRGGVGLVIGVSLFVFAAYYSFLIAGEELASRGMLPPWIAMWGANVLFTVLAIPLVLRMGRASGSTRGGGFGEWLEHLRFRLRRRPAATPVRA